jgi:hypothetical protein
MFTKFWMGWGLASLLSMFLLVGCTEESTPGGPGAATTTQEGEPADDEATFNLDMPAAATNIEQGQSQTVTIGVDRGSDFTGDVTVTLIAPEGITVEPKEATIKAGSDDVEIAVQVAPTVPVGEKIIDISGSGGSGPAATGQLKIEVTKGEGSDTSDPATSDPANADPGASAKPPADPSLSPAPPADPANPEGGAPPQKEPNPNQ